MLRRCAGTHFGTRTLHDGGPRCRAGHRRARHGRAWSGNAHAFGRCGALRERLARTGKNLSRPRRGCCRSGQGLGSRRGRTAGGDHGYWWHRRRCRNLWGRRHRGCGCGWCGSARRLGPGWFGRGRFGPGCAMGQNRWMNGTARQGRTNGRGQAGRRPALFHRWVGCGCRRGRRRRFGLYQLRSRSGGAGGRRFFSRHGLLMGLFLSGVFRFRFGHQIGYIEAVSPAQLNGDVLVDRAGVRFLLSHSQLREQVENLVSLDF